MSSKYGTFKCPFPGNKKLLFDPGWTQIRRLEKNGEYKESLQKQNVLSDLAQEDQSSDVISALIKVRILCLRV